MSTTDGVSGPSATTSGTAAAKGGIGALDKDAFLKLLVAQLKYQNPLQPTDPSQMMAQTAQFTMVESLQAISQTQADASAWQRVVAGQGMVGRKVTGLSGDAPVSGVVRGLTMTADGPLLELADGTRLPVAAVLSVTAADTPTA